METWRAYTCFYCKGRNDACAACTTCQGWGYIRVSADGAKIEPQPWPSEPEEKKFDARRKYEVARRLVYAPHWHEKGWTAAQPPPAVAYPKMASRGADISGTPAPGEAARQSPASSGQPTLLP